MRETKDDYEREVEHATRRGCNVVLAIIFIIAIIKLLAL